MTVQIMYPPNLTDVHICAASEYSNFLVVWRLPKHQLVAVLVFQAGAFILVCSSATRWIASSRNPFSRPASLSICRFCPTPIDSCALQERPIEGCRPNASSAQSLVFPSLYVNQGALHHYQFVRPLLYVSRFCRSTLHSYICVRHSPFSLLPNGLKRISVGQLPLLKISFASKGRCLHGATNARIYR